MNLSKTNPTIIEAHIGNPFQLPPAPFAIALLKHRENPDAAIDRNRFYFRNRSYDFKVHGVLEVRSAFEEQRNDSPDTRCLESPEAFKRFSPLPNILHEGINHAFAP